MKIKPNISSYLSSLAKLLVLQTVFGLATVSQFHDTEVMAQPLVINHYSFSEIERLIDHDKEAQVIVGYELGQVNWSRRTLNNLAVGTHVILSPTGGWGEQDLESLAIKRAAQKFERLSTEIFKNDLELSRCQWAQRSQLFQSQSPHWLSDGSIHLPSTIRFEVYEACSVTAMSKKEKLNHQRINDNQLYDEHKVKLEHNLGSWFLNLDKLLQQSSRQIAVLKLKTDGKDFNLSCLQAFPQLLAFRSNKKLSDHWKAIRWFWHQKKLSYKSLYSRLKFAHDLGEVKCAQQGQILKLQQAIKESVRQELSNLDNAFELWIWIDSKN